MNAHLLSAASIAVRRDPCGGSGANQTLGTRLGGPLSTLYRHSARRIKSTPTPPGFPEWRLYEIDEGPARRKNHKMLFLEIVFGVAGGIILARKISHVWNERAAEKGLLQLARSLKNQHHKPPSEM